MLTEYSIILVTIIFVLKKLQLKKEIKEKKELHEWIDYNF